MTIKNRKLALPESINLLKYLQKNFPVSNFSCTFQREPILWTKLPNGKMFYIKGRASGSNITISTIEQSQDELRLIAHEYRHTIQKQTNLFPDKFVHMINGRPATLNLEAERDADHFAEIVIPKFLEVYNVK